VRERIAEAVARGDALAPVERDALALELHAWQRRHAPVVAALSDAVPPAAVTDIPAVPVGLFKEADVGSVPAHEAGVVFRTSGTTGETRGVVRLRDTALYDLGARDHVRRCVPDLPTQVVSLCSHAPDSSLGHMVADFGGGAHMALFDTARGVSPEAWAFLAEVRGPIFLATTAFALDALLAMDGAASLDARSVVMVTGGFKGRAVRLDAPGLYRALPARLGSPRVVGEYGMTELSSQLWTAPVACGAVPGPFLAPPWMAVHAVDPATGAPVDGEGLLTFTDLCNVDTAVRIETLDLGTVEHAGDRAWVHLRGRMQGGEARGCSLAAEAFVGTRA
jgi:acyl-CoA synthetase (AMP-forming)/AMP-acid ligase II